MPRGKSSKQDLIQSLLAELDQAAADKQFLARQVCRLLVDTQRFATRHCVASPRIVDGVAEDLCCWVSTDGQKAVRITSASPEEQGPAYLIVNDDHFKGRGEAKLTRVLASAFSAKELLKIAGVVTSFWKRYVEDARGGATGLPTVTGLADSLATALKGTRMRGRHRS